MRRLVTDCAMQVTQTVHTLQSKQRKAFIEHVKLGLTSKLQIKKAWQHLVQNLTHERYAYMKFLPVSL